MELLLKNQRHEAVGKKLEMLDQKAVSCTETIVPFLYSVSFYSYSFLRVNNLPLISVLREGTHLGLS